MGQNNNNPLKVSIVLPTYNRATLIPACVQSVLDQTYTNWELIIADDGSSDNTENTGNKLQHLDERIIYHKNKSNVGLPQNRNISLSLASGDLIWFIEDDMILKNNCLKMLIETWIHMQSMGNNPIGAICPALVSEETQHDVRRGILDVARSRKESELVKNPCVIDRWTGLIYRNFSPVFEGIIEIEDCHSCSLYKTDLFNRIRYDSQAYIGNYIGEESDFHFRIRREGYKIFFQPRAILYHHTVSSGGCRLPLTKWLFFFIRNHIVFLHRNYRIRSLYMIPIFFVYNFYILIRYLK